MGLLKKLSLLFLGRAEKERRPERHIWNVVHSEKVVDKSGRVHLPKRFLDQLDISRGEIVQIFVDWESEIRIRKKTRTFQQVPEQRVDSFGKILLPKKVRHKYRLELGSKVLVSLFKFPGEIEVKKIQ